MTPFRIAAVFCVYNEEEYLEYAVRAILPAVDRVFLLLGKAPYNAYNPHAREVSHPDQTEQVVQRLCAGLPKIAVVRGTWSSEVEHRNAGLELCLQEKMDYYWLVDGDEIYRPDHLEKIRRGIAARPECGTFIIKCHIFWRSFLYRIPAQEMSWRPRRIFKITSSRRILGLRFPRRCSFIGQNQMNSLGSIHEFPPEEAVFYHFSYARSAQAMEDKFRTFSHAHEIKQSWIDGVWKRWPQNRQMVNIHPIDPPKFPRALRAPLDDLPDVLKPHPYYGLDIID